jgi:hypothetical protein
MLSHSGRLAGLLALILPACVVHTGDNDSPPPPPANAIPWVSDAEAGCYWDGGYHDDIWYFEAYTGDANGAYDVVEVWADVYDEIHGETYIESFELYPTHDPAVWFSDWIGSSTWLDCWYDGYTVDFVAYDSLGATGVATVWAYTY